MGEGVGERVYTIDYYRKKYDEEMEWVRQVILTSGNLSRIMEENINILLKDNKELRDELEFVKKENKGLVKQLLKYEEKRNNLYDKNLSGKKENEKE